MSATVELLEEMRGRVPMYVGSNSITKLAAFLRGYQYGREKHGFGQDDGFLTGFQELIQERYEVKTSKTWEDIIFFQCSNDDEAIDMFWCLFDEFCSLEVGRAVGDGPIR